MDKSQDVTTGPHWSDLAVAWSIAAGVCAVGGLEFSFGAGWRAFVMPTIAAFLLAQVRLARALCDEGIRVRDLLGRASFVPWGEITGVALGSAGGRVVQIFARRRLILFPFGLWRGTDVARREGMRRLLLEVQTRSLPLRVDTADRSEWERWCGLSEKEC